MDWNATSYENQYGNHSADWLQSLLMISAVL